MISVLATMLQWGQHGFVFPCSLLNDRHKYSYLKHVEKYSEAYDFLIQYWLHKHGLQKSVRRYVVRTGERRGMEN